MEGVGSAATRSRHEALPAGWTVGPPKNDPGVPGWSVAVDVREKMNPRPPGRRSMGGPRMSIAAVVRHGRSALAATSGSPTVALTGPADSTGPSGAAAVDPARDQKRLIRNLAIAGVASCAAILASVGSVFAAPVRVPFSFETFSPCTGELVQVEGSRLAFSPDRRGYGDECERNHLHISQRGPCHHEL